MRGGGVAGLVSTTVVDSAALSPSDAQALCAMVEESGLLGPGSARRSPSTPDGALYELSVQDGADTVAHRLGERDLTPALRALVAWLESVPGRREFLDPPG